MKVGIIGCGKIAQVRHIPEYLENPDVEIVGYYDWNADRAAELAAQFGGKAYSTEDELLADKEMDAVSVCVANNAHAKVTIKAADENGKYLMIGQNQRFAKAHVKAKELISEGVIGDVITFKTTFGHGGPETWGIDGAKNTWFFDKSRSVMGAMADRGVH